jgi:hypothetical protein
MDESERAAHAEILSLYEQSAENIRTFQNRQASATSLIALIYTGLVGFARSMRPGTNLDTIVGISITGVAVVGVIWLMSLQKAIHRARLILRRAQGEIHRQRKGSHRPPRASKVKPVG